MTRVSIVSPMISSSVASPCQTLRRQRVSQQHSASQALHTIQRWCFQCFSIFSFSLYIRSSLQNYLLIIKGLLLYCIVAAGASQSLRIHTISEPRLALKMTDLVIFNVCLWRCIFCAGSFCKYDAPQALCCLFQAHAVNRSFENITTLGYWSPSNIPYVLRALITLGTHAQRGLRYLFLCKCVCVCLYHVPKKWLKSQSVN